jgi:predicted permease
MRWLAEARERLRGLLFRAREEAEMDEELRFHLEMETGRLVREAGLGPTEARRRAAVAFGGVDKTKEEVREARGLAWVPGLSLDARLGARMLVKHRGLTLIGGFAIAVAIAIGAISFEVITQMLHAVLPVDEGERVVAVQYATDNPGNPERRVLHESAAWREELVSVEQLGAFLDVEHNLVSGVGPPGPVRVAEITSSAFLVARTPPLLGRPLLPEDERPGAPPVVVIGHDVWRARFAGDPGIVGRTIQLGADRHLVVGVMPRGFAFPVSHQFWIPLRARPSDHERIGGPEVYVFGRLAPGATLREAQAELTTLGRRAAAAHPETHGRLRLRVLPYTREHVDVEDPVVVWVWWIVRLLLGGLLVVVAVNLAVLVYARTVARSGEIAVRSALGASRRRILGQLFVEALALSALGAAAGLLLAGVVLGRMRSWIASTGTIDESLPYWIRLQLSPGTVAYASGLALLAALIVGVLPGLRATGGRLHAGLRELGGGGGGRLGGVWTSLIVAQVAVAVAILPPALFAVWQVARTEVARPGFPAGEFVAGEVALDDEIRRPGDAGWEGSELQSRFGARQRELMGRLEAVPGVAAVTFSSGVPGDDPAFRRVELDGGPPPPDAGTPTVAMYHVAPGMLEAYGARVVAGRALRAGDPGGAAEPVVVNRTFARRFLGGRSALGVRFRYSAPRSGRTDAGPPGEWHEVVGVVDDFPALPLELGTPASAAVYHPAAPGAVHPAVVAVRFRGGVPADFAGSFRRIAAGVDPALQLEGVMPLAETYDRLRAPSRLAAWALGLVTASVLLLSAAGIYALMSFTVAQRTREIGIRAALGAHPRRILAVVFGRVARQLALGLLAGSLASGALVSLTGLAPARAAALLLAVAAIMLAVGLLAALGPARRGLRIEPTEALRAGG